MAADSPTQLTRLFTIESLERRTLYSASSSLVSGRVVDAIRQTDGITVHTPLTDRVVFDDSNGNGKPDKGEAFTETNLDGVYKIRLPEGTDDLRLDELAGWTAAGAGTDAATLTVAHGSGGVIAGPTLSTKMTRPVRIDVLAAYTPAAREGRTGHEMAAAIRTLFLEANQVYANSNTNVVLNPVLITTTTYIESGNISNDLDALAGGDGGLAALPKLRDRYKADLVTLFTEGARTGGKDIGLSYEFTTDSDSADFADSVIALQDDGEDGTTLAHEIGHNLGAGHDKPDNDGPGVTPYAYGYSFVGTNGRTYQDVMSYADGIVLPFFSTPDFAWAGEPIGNAKTADNARIIREDASTVAAYR